MASMQAANDALQLQVHDLQSQRSDLKDQRSGLAERMGLIEQERQASTAALLRVQGRLLELEAVGPRPSLQRWWQRQSFWGVAGALVLGLSGFGWQS